MILSHKKETWIVLSLQVHERTSDRHACPSNHHAVHCDSKLRVCGNTSLITPVTNNWQFHIASVSVDGVVWPAAPNRCPDFVFTAMEERTLQLYWLFQCLLNIIVFGRSPVNNLFILCFAIKSRIDINKWSNCDWNINNDLPSLTK